jgi:hypothetical protein
MGVPYRPSVLAQQSLSIPTPPPASSAIQYFARDDTSPAVTLSCRVRHGPTPESAVGRSNFSLQDVLAK